MVDSLSFRSSRKREPVAGADPGAVGSEGSHTHRAGSLWTVRQKTAAIHRCAFSVLPKGPEPARKMLAEPPIQDGSGVFTLRVLAWLEGSFRSGACMKSCMFFTSMCVFRVYRPLFAPTQSRVLDPKQKKHRSTGMPREQVRRVEESQSIWQGASPIPPARNQGAHPVGGVWTSGAWKNQLRSAAGQRLLTKLGAGHPN